MTIRTRLTILGTIVTMTACGLVCVALYVGLRASLHAEIDNFLVGEVQEFMEILREDAGESIQTVERDIQRELGSRVRNDLTFRLLDKDGNLIVSSKKDDTLQNPWPLKTLGLASSVPSFVTTDVGAERIPTRVCSIASDLPPHEDSIVQATYSLSGVNLELAHFRNLALVVFTLSGLISLVGGRLMADKCLKPIHVMTRSARQFGTQDLSQRLERSHEEDELDNLASVLNDFLARIEHQVFRIRQFTADAAHELRTPLAALRGNAEIALAETASFDDRKRTLEESIEEYDRLSRLTNDLLLLARADADEAKFKRSPVLLNEVINDVVGLYSAIADEKHVALNSNLDVSVSIQGDHERIRQVLCNLLDNSLKHTSADGKIDISLTIDEDAACIMVADTGVGIEADALPHVFERFYRVDAARSRSNGGSGLGLPICRAIIEAHGGTISINSQSGVGTAVTIRMPIAG